jgi:hypothetical protein
VAVDSVVRNNQVEPTERDGWNRLPSKLRLVQIQDNTMQFEVSCEWLVVVPVLIFQATILFSTPFSVMASLLNILEHGLSVLLRYCWRLRWSQAAFESWGEVNLVRGKQEVLPCGSKKPGNPQSSSISSALQGAFSIQVVLRSCTMRPRLWHI